jgi:hypothetical protein
MAWLTRYISLCATVAMLSAAVWIVTASWQTTSWLRAVGLLLALDLGLYSFVAPWVSITALYPSLLLLVPWFVLVAPHRARRMNSQLERWACASTARSSPLARDRRLRDGFRLCPCAAISVSAHDQPKAVRSATA